MNREQRRKAGVTSKPATYTLTREQLENIKNEITNKAIEESFIMMMGLPVIALHDHYGFGKKRLSDFTDVVFGLYEDVQSGEITLNDVINVLKEEANYQIVVGKGKDYVT